MKHRNDAIENDNQGLEADEPPTESKTRPQIRIKTQNGAEIILRKKAKNLGGAKPNKMREKNGDGPQLNDQQ